MSTKATIRQHHLTPNGLARDAELKRLRGRRLAPTDVAWARIESGAGSWALALDLLAEARA